MQLLTLTGQDSGGSPVIFGKCSAIKPLKNLNHPSNRIQQRINFGPQWSKHISNDILCMTAAPYGVMWQSLIH